MPGWFEQELEDSDAHALKRHLLVFHTITAEGVDAVRRKRA